MVARTPAYNGATSPLHHQQQLQGRFLPGLIKHAPFIRHLKPWPGFLDRDLDLIGRYCGATLDTLDLAFTRWGGGSWPSPGAGTGSETTIPRQQSPGYMSLATTQSLIELLPRLKRLKTLTLDSTIGLNMNNVLQYLTDLYSCRNDTPLTRVSMDSVQSIDEAVFMAFLTACCSRQRRSCSTHNTDFYVSDTSRPSSIRSLSMRRTDCSSFSFEFSKSGSHLQSLQPATGSSSVVSTTAMAPVIETVGGRATTPSLSSLSPVPVPVPGDTTVINHANTLLSLNDILNNNLLLIEELALDETGISNLALSNFSSHCPWLRELSLSGNLHLTCDGLEALATHCPRLEKINVERCTSIQDRGFQSLFQQCQQLNDVRLSGTKVADAAILVLLGMTASDCDDKVSSRSSPWSTPTHSRSSSPTGFRTTGSRTGACAPQRKAEKIRCVTLSQCAEISEVAVNAILSSCSNLQTLDISMNLRIKVADIFWHSTLTSPAISPSCSSSLSNGKDNHYFSRSRSGTVDGSCHASQARRPYWACTQSLQVLNISSIDFSMPHQPVVLKQVSGRTGTNTRAHSRQGSISSSSIPYSALYNQLQQLSNLQSLTMGGTDFVLDLYHDSQTSWSSMTTTSSTATSTLGRPTKMMTPSSSHGLIRVCQSLQRLQLFTLTKIDPLSSSLVGFRELRWMIQNMSSASIRQLCVGQGVGLAVGFGNSLVECTRKPQSTRGDSLVFSVQDRLSKMDQVDRDMDNSEAFMAWCRTARPNLSIKVLEW
ncbi:hypothetical protein BGZ94_007361 [Podila epigama]|nr:hypothetical protein BGZ94_007361 [Podila epigama]